MSDLSDKFPVGTKVQAVWSEDGEWYVTVQTIQRDICNFDSCLVYFPPFSYILPSSFLFSMFD